MLLIINITKEQRKTLLNVYPSLKSFVEKAIINATNQIAKERLYITDEELEAYSDRVKICGSGPNRKRVVTQATKDKTSKTLKEKYKGKHYPLFEETKIKIGNIHRGKTVSQATRDKVSRANKGKKRTAEQRENISLAKTGQKYKKRVKVESN